jgi:hypothetical protein
MCAEANFAAECLDTFFNGRPAPKRTPDQVRIRLSRVLMADLVAGKPLKFRASGVEIDLVPPARRP